MKGFVELTLHPIHGGGQWFVDRYGVHEIVCHPGSPAQVFVQGGAASQFVVETPERIAELLAAAKAEDE